MSLFYKRPLASVLSVFIAGSFFLFLLSTPLRIALSFCLLLSGILLLFFRRLRRIFPALLLSMAAGGLLITFCFDVMRLPYQRYEGEHVTAVGEITEISYRNDDFYSIAVDCDTIEETAYSFRLSASLTSDVGLAVGDKIELCGDFHLLVARDFYDESLVYPLAEGSMAILLNADLRHTEEPESFGINRFFAALRQSYAARIEAGVSGESGHLLSTLLLGEYSVSEKTVLDFRYTGLLPLLAISGTHFTVLSFALLLLLKKLHVGRKRQTVALLFFLVFYTALSGFLPSVMRAACMLVFLLFGYLFGRPYDPLTALTLAASLLLFAFPYLIANTGFLLSVSATFGILFFGEAVRGSRFDPERIENPILHYLYASLFLTGSAIIGSLPVTAFLCGEASLLSFPGNLLLSPLMSILLFLASACLLFPIPPITTVATLLSDFLLSLLAKAARIPHMLLSLRPIPIQLLLLLLVGWLVISLGVRTPKKAHALRTLSALLATVVLYAALFPATSYAGLRYLFVSNGKSDALVLYGGSTALLFDASDHTDTLLYDAVKAARKASISEMDAVLFSHYHLRQASDLRSAASYMKIRRLILPHPDTDTECALAARLCDVAAEHDIALTFYTPAAVIELGGITCVHHPRSENARLLSFRLGTKTVTYMSASYYKGIDRPAALTAIHESDLLILGNLGSEAATAFPYPISKENAPRILVSDLTLSELWESSLPEHLLSTDITLDVFDARGYIWE